MSLSLAELQSLYDRNRFIEAYRQSAHLWQPSQKLGELSTDQLIFGGRLAARLGGWRVSRWLFRSAFSREPLHPKARYFAQGLHRRDGKLLEELRRWDANPELDGADANTQASWLAAQGVVWATVRDFARAHTCIGQAKSLDVHESWVFSCEASVFGLQDRWEEALKSAEISWEVNPGTPYGASSLGESLMNLRRVQEAAERLWGAAEGSESFEVANTACWHLCAQAEALQGQERKRCLAMAEQLADQVAKLAPLADRETRTWFARARLDIAELKDDHASMERWANDARSPFHRKLLENLRKNPEGLRIRMPFRRAIQKHDECLPTSVASALAAMGTAVDAEAMAAEITFGGTPEWAAAEWLDKRGLAVRFFLVTPGIARQLIRNGIAFVMMLEADASAHAVAAVGLDEAAGTLIIHDPNMIRTTEYLLESLGNGEAPLGPRGMASVPRELVKRLDELLPKGDVDVMSARMEHQRALLLGGPSAGRRVVEKLAAICPEHPVSRLLQAMQAVEDGRVGAALIVFQKLMNEFPGSAFVRARLLACCRSSGDTALMRKTLARVVERGALPGIQSQQSWRYPPGTYVSEYADLLRASAESRNQAHSLLAGVIGRERSLAQAWHILGDLLWDDKDLGGAVLGYRIAAGLAESNEHYARAYCDALGNTARLENGLKWLEERAERFGGSARAVATWVTWLGALEDWGRPQRALAACAGALKVHGESAELLSFAVPFFARMGQWEEAESLLEKLKGAGNAELFHEAAADFFQRKGELEKALQQAEAWAREAPLAMNARATLLSLIAKRDGADAAAELAAKWSHERPGHDRFEELYSQHLEQSSAPRWKRYALLRRRVKRNREDAWAWRQIAFNCVAEYESSDQAGKQRLQKRLPNLLRECERTAPGEAPTMRLRAQWCEAQREWDKAIEHWTKSIEREPHNFYGYRRLWETLARSNAEERRALWQKLSDTLLSQPGRLTAARDTIMLVAQRFGVSEAEEAVARWQNLRPDDPEVTEAYADLLLQYGHGRSDAQRALAILQPAIERFPYDQGLRFSLADAQRKLGQFQQAEETLSEIIRRHPENTTAQIQLAQVDARHGKIEEALRTLASAAARDPRNVEIPDAQARTYIEANRNKEARAVLDAAGAKFRKSVTWREKAIQLYTECGDNEAAVRTARGGVEAYPRGAYLWFLLARTLNGMRQYAGQGEIEFSLRKSLELNEGLFDAADWLAMLLVEQRQYDEAESVMKKMKERLNDPSPAMGRLAWIRRERGDKQRAREEMASVLRETPWYRWGWSVLMEWLGEDQAWNEAKRVLRVIPPAQRTNTQFRRQRLTLLGAAGLPQAELDSEWNSLLQDFPEEVSLHLLRYDSLRDSKRPAEAAEVLERVRPLDPDSPFLLARVTEVLANDANRKQQSVEVLLLIMFREKESSTWPVEFAWKAVRDAGLEETAYQKACERLRKGERPTPRALSALATCAVRLRGTEKRTLQPYWRTWMPDRGARELLRLQKMVDAAGWGKQGYRSRVMKQLSDVGYVRLVARYWKNNRTAVEDDTGAWEETARALMVLKKKKQVQKLLEGWRERSGVGMWAVANYVTSFSGLGKSQVEKVRAACRDALAGLPHDHCAKYLVHRQMETCALLGDEKGVLETWKEYRDYFNGKLEEGEWFAPRRKDLLTDLLVMARALQDNDKKLYKRMLRSLRWKLVGDKLKFGDGGGNIAWRHWWWLIWVLFLFLQIVLQQFWLSTK